MFPNPISWLGYGKTNLNLTQQKHTFTDQKKCTTTQNKASFSHLLRHPAWICRGPILVLVLHKFITYLNSYSNLTALGRDFTKSHWQTTIHGLVCLKGDMQRFHKIDVKVVSSCLLQYKPVCV